MTAPAQETAAVEAVLAAHAMVSGFDECGIWCGYSCTCGDMGDSDAWHRAHVAAAIVAALTADASETQP